MTGWLRTIGSYFVDYLAWGILVFGLLLGAAWEGWTLYKRREWRVSEKQQADITASRVGWWPDQQKKK